MSLYQRLTVAQYTLFALCIAGLIWLAIQYYFVAFAILAFVAIIAQSGLGYWGQWYLGRQLTEPMTEIELAERKRELGQS